MSKLTIDQKADIMLEHLSRFVNIDWNQEEFYLNHIKDGFRDIERMEETEDAPMETERRRTD
jgi:hypothetical protein